METEYKAVDARIEKGVGRRVGGESYVLRLTSATGPTLATARLHNSALSYDMGRNESSEQTS